MLVTGINPTPAGEGKTTVRSAWRGAAPPRQEGGRLPARAVARAGVRRQGRRHRRRLRAGRADGRDQPPLHGRHPRHHVRAQPARRRCSTTTCIRATRSDIDPRRVTWPRTIDMNDRALRNMRDRPRRDNDGPPREERFDITARQRDHGDPGLASELARSRGAARRIIVGLDPARGSRSPPATSRPPAR